MSISRYFLATELLFALMVIGLVITGNAELYNIVYISIFVFASARMIVSNSGRFYKLCMLLVYFFALILQMVVCDVTIASERAGVSIAVQFAHRIICIVVMMLPVVVSRYVTVGKYSKFYLPSLQEIATLSFTEIKNNSDRIIEAVNEIGRAGKSLSPENLKTIADDLPRHSSFRYINNGTLTPDFFAEAEKHMNDPFLYIVISSTGSAASELISVFTQRQYNHASLSFDRDLKTIISYNGGERAYPPGLNHEMIEYFNKKQDASIMVYKLSCTVEQKKKVLDKVKEINREGSAYNMMGLVLKYSHKPNIMFCSQFVYKMLQYAELSYFTKKGESVEPSDLVEKDYHRKLQFDYEIFLNQFYGKSITKAELIQNEE